MFVAVVGDLVGLGAVALLIYIDVSLTYVGANEYFILAVVGIDLNAVRLHTGLVAGFSYLFVGIGLVGCY